MAVKRLLLAALAALALAHPAAAAGQCRDLTHSGQSFTLCDVSADADLRLFHTAPSGAVLGGFGAVNAQLATEGKSLAFAMNAGMYHSDRSPVGLLVLEGQERARLITSAGPGNFGLLPNGVFCKTAARFLVVETRRFAAKPPNCRYATQSGPMLVIDGALHPRFLPDSDSRFIRNGIGVSEDGQTAYLVISNQPVSFTEFGRLFRDALKVPNALYFDGKISRLYAPNLNRSDFGFQMGPIIGLATDRP